MTIMNNRCLNCNMDFDPCEDCEKKEQETRDKQSCHLAELMNVYVSSNSCGYIDIDIKTGGCAKCGYSINY